MTGRYQTARPYSVEALFLYAICKYRQKEDPDSDAWMTMGICARLAMRMGYHRDPRYLGDISPFEGEMRRRTFSLIANFELLLSFQVGLPAIIHEDECDTESPRNLLDTDFDETCKDLPPSRPPNDPTPMLYFCFKIRLGKTFRRVYRHALSLDLHSYDSTMKLDGELRESYQALPSCLRMRPLASSATDEAYVALNSLNIGLIYLKGLCVLHRYSIGHERSNPTFDYSRRTCISAALEILSYQAELHTACQPGGKFFDDKWMLSSLTLHDFLLAAMITCLDLYESRHKPATTPSEDLIAQIQKHDALRLSQDIWMSRRAYSRDARRASSVLAVMLRKVPRPSAPLCQRTSTAFQESANGADETRINEDTLVSSLSTDFDVASQEIPADLTNFDSTDPLNTIFTESDYIDWVNI